MLNQTVVPSLTRILPVHPVAPVHPDMTTAFGEHPGIVTTEYAFKKDEEIYGEGEPTSYVYEVVHGAVRTYKLLSDGRRQIGAFLLPGDVFGLGSDNAHRMSAEAIVDTTVRVVKRSRLEALATSDAQTANRLWKIATGEVRHAENHILLLGRKTATERVANFLLEMDKRFTGAGMLALPMCRRDIGDYLGLTLETVSRTLSQLHDAGVLELTGARRITLRNRKRLVDLDA